jgi:hypothetical protein
LLGRLGAAAAPAVPALVQRLFEGTPTVRDHVAPALARILPDLPAEMQTWLCLLANPLLSAATNLRTALTSPELPTEVRRAFGLVCARRRAWRHHIAAGGEGPAPVPDPRTLDSSVKNMLSRVTELADLARQSACKGVGEERRRKERGERASTKETAWLLARLCELLA